MSGRRSRTTSWSSDEVGSADSGSSIETQVDSSSGRRGHRGGRYSGRFSSSDLSLAHGEERKIRRSLERKLLSDNGARLSKIERRLLRDDQSREGSVSVSTFKAALAAESTSDGASIQSDEVLWLIQKLRGRNGRNVKILKMRALLENEETDGTTRGHRPGSGRRRQVERRHHQQHTARRHSTSRHGESRRRGDNLPEDGGGRVGSGGQTTSESDASSVGATLKWRSSPQPPAKWAIRHGTVGQWLHDVAAPMERKLFFEFLRDLEKFERRNGLDHYRVRPIATSRRHRGLGSVNDDGTSGRCREDDGTTVVHLGPMLKASIRFFV